MSFIQPSWRRCEGAASVWLISGCLRGAGRLHGEDRQKLNTSEPSGQAMPEWSKESDAADKPKTLDEKQYCVCLRLLFALCPPLRSALLRFALLRFALWQDFEASTKFLGARPGFVFKRGRRGCAPLPCSVGGVAALGI